MLSMIYPVSETEAEEFDSARILPMRVTGVTKNVTNWGTPYTAQEVAVTFPDGVERKGWTMGVSEGYAICFWEGAFEPTVDMFK